MTRKCSRMIAVIMLVIAGIFVVVALRNPQASFPWSNTITYAIYGVYLIAMTALFAAPFKKQK